MFLGRINKIYPKLSSNIFLLIQSSEKPNTVCSLTYNAQKRGKKRLKLQTVKPDEVAHGQTNGAGRMAG